MGVVVKDLCGDGAKTAAGSLARDADVVVLPMMILMMQATAAGSRIKGDYSSRRGGVNSGR